METTEIIISATGFNEENFGAIKNGNQKIKFAYNKANKGKNVSIWLTEGIINEPKFQIVIPHDELLKVLEFMVGETRTVNINIDKLCVPSKDGSFPSKEEINKAMGDILKNSTPERIDFKVNLSEPLV